SGVMNILLDATLVLLLPAPYKLAGAAIATAMSQVVGGTVPLVYFARKNNSLLRIGKTKFDGKIILKATINGSSEFMTTVSMSLVGMLFNVQLLKYAGENGVAAYGVMMYVSMIFSALFIGYAIGTSPIFSYHDGAENHKELKNLLKRSIVLIGGFAVCMVIAGELFATPLAEIFVGYDAELMNTTVSGFRIFALSFLFMGYAIFGSSFFTALNEGLTSALISFLRTMVFQVAAVLLLPLILGIDGIWYSIIVAEFMAMALSGFFVILKRKKHHCL
ncbi:MAG: MATE family efflux transporter, partial [Clostridia bacterium]|nr:MATE family efflux transporter [Clostridia bacterium]